jgi:hypothetical protein
MKLAFMHGKRSRKGLVQSLRYSSSMCAHAQYHAAILCTNQLTKQYQDSRELSPTAFIMRSYHGPMLLLCIRSMKVSVPVTLRQWGD